MKAIKSLGYGLAVFAVVLAQAIVPVARAYAAETPTEPASTPALSVAQPTPVAPLVAGCSTNSFDMTLTNESGTQDYTVWTKLKLNFSGAIPDGDTTYTKTATLPAELAGNVATYNLYAPDGTTVMGHMVSDGHKVTFTFDSTYLATHNCVTWNATLYAGFAETVQPGTPYDLSFVLNGVTQIIHVVTDECTYCGGLYTGPDKWAVVSTDGLVAISGINSRVTATNNETVTITDRVDSHQTIRCNELRLVRQSNVLDSRGSLVAEADVTALATITCAPHVVTVSISQTLAQKVYTLVVMADTDGTLPAYTDTATVLQNGQEIKITRSATVYGGGGGGNGTQLAPAISIEKWDTDRVTGAHDTADDAKNLDATTAQLIHFTITNTGNETLVGIVVSDKTTTGVGTLTDITCDFSPLGGAATGTAWDGPFAPGDTFDCTGSLPALGYDAVHGDTASVTGVGVSTGTEVSNSNQWHGVTGPAPVTPPTPEVPVTPGKGSITLPITPVVSPTPLELPHTGPSDTLPMWAPLVAGSLTYLLVLKLRKR